MEEKEIIPYNTPEDGVAPTITTMYARLGTNNLTPGEYGGAMGIVEVINDKMEEMYKNKSVQKLVDSGKIAPDKIQFLDTYNQIVRDDVSGTITTRIDASHHTFVTEPTSCASRKRGDEHKIETRKDELANCVTSIDTDSMVQEPLKIPQATKQGYIECPVGGVFDASYPDSDKRRGRVQENGEVSPALTTNSEGAVLRYEGVEPNPLLQKGAVIANTQLNCYRGTIDEPAPTVCAAGGMGGGHVAMVVENVEPQVLTPLRTEEGRQLRKQGIEKFSNRALYPREDGVSNTITSVQKDNLLQEPNGTEYKGKFIKEGDGLYTDTTQEFFRGGLDGVSRTLKAETHDAGTCVMKGARYRIRKLTEREVFRLMGLEDEDIDKIQAAGISKTSQYRLAGNSIVVNVLYHIFRKMFIDQKCEDKQLSLFDL